MGSELIESLVREHRDEMLAFVRRRAGHLLDPEDVFQQAAVRALAGVDQLRDAARGRAWLFRILRNVLTDELRSLGVPVSTLRHEPGAPETEEGDPCRCALELAKTLKPEYATMLERVVLEDVPVTTLASELGVTPNNAMVRLHRARRALRDKLQEHCGVSSLRACLSCVCNDRGCCATEGF
jgi:RNA polymerase sigma-70 factor (ECF subfamily)